MCTLSVKHVQAFLSVDHMHTSSWACLRFQLSMCTLSVEHVHASSWACTCACLQLCMWHKATVEHAHVYTSIWVLTCAHLHLRIYMLSVEHVTVKPWNIHLYIPQQWPIKSVQVMEIFGKLFKRFYEFSLCEQRITIPKTQNIPSSHRIQLTKNFV